MRQLADRDRIERFMEAFGREAGRAVRVYLVGGTTAVLIGWRPSTVDIDLVMQPDDDALLLYAQALAKVERGHRQDLEDVRAMIALGLVTRVRALEYFERIEPQLYRFPAIDPPSFRKAVEEMFGAPGR